MPVQWWEKDTFHFKLFIMWFLKVAPGNRGTALHDAQLWNSPPRLGKTVECGWCEAGFGLELANALGMQLWTDGRGRACARPHPQSGHLWGAFMCFARVNVSTSDHVCCLQVSVSQWWGPAIPGERGDIHTHFLFEGLWRALLNHSPEMSGMWDRTRLQRVTSLKDLTLLSVSWEQFCSEGAHQVEMTAEMEISCPVLDERWNKVDRGDIAPVPLLHPTRPSIIPPYFPPTTNYSCSLCQWGVIWSAVLGVFERSELRSLSSSTSTFSACRSSRRRKVVRQEEKQESVRHMEKRWEFFCMQPLWFLAWEIVNVSCLVLV